jgi:uncharacterized membrane protein YgcG
MYESECEACGRRRLLRGADAAAAFRARWVPSWHRRQARLLALSSAGAEGGGTSGGGTSSGGGGTSTDDG